MTSQYKLLVEKLFKENKITFDELLVLTNEVQNIIQYPIITYPNPIYKPLEIYCTSGTSTTNTTHKL